jgi:tetratricopeptide (TPR) repeat protein
MADRASIYADEDAQVLRVADSFQVRSPGRDPSHELIRQELAVHEGRLEDVIASVRSVMKKDDGNRLFARGSFTGAVAAYREALACVANHDTPASGRARAVLRSNLSGCFLAMAKKEDAVREAREAIAEDETFEKAHLRLGAALEKVSGSRTEALRAYERVANNEVAMRRIAVLQVPIKVTAGGVVGVEEGSLDVRHMPRYDCATAFFARSLLPSEPLLNCEPRAQSLEYKTRMWLRDYACLVENRGSRSLIVRSKRVGRTAFFSAARSTPCTCSPSCTF